ncbi:hypothetical protein IQ22_04671 [Pseudomonas duriflava]|uniref:Uncharacterized protein n=1 Tax=Pseudomonas duriflava TaxID=459528 RepID=A0A562PKP0_9PSED|nr:hypothetical protein [Pseudomonas duriflava]TWI45032.1 hypothetical protein IQ22_04671 [Pseudomonas duriflava]
MSDKEEFEAWWTLHSAMMSVMHSIDLGEAEKQFALLAWQASRAALVVELPKFPIPRRGSYSKAKLGWIEAYRSCRQSIEAAGIQVRP